VTVVCHFAVKDRNTGGPVHANAFEAKDPFCYLLQVHWLRLASPAPAAFCFLHIANIDERLGLMKKCYRAELTGVFGIPVDDNPTGAVEEAAYKAEGLNYRYLMIEVKPEDLQTAMDSVKAFGMKGINLTMPHKVTVVPMLDELSEAAGIIGAVNTVVNRDGKLFGENTDGKGFVRALEDSGESVEGKSVTILGAGGAARAIAVECALNHAKKINIVNRNTVRGKELVQILISKTDVSAEYVSWGENLPIPRETQILINATSIGFSPNIKDKPDIDYRTVTSSMVVCDVVFSPADTEFLKAVRARGAKTINGLGMLASQAALNFTLWTGKEAPLELMKKVLAEETA